MHQQNSAVREGQYRNLDHRMALLTKHMYSISKLMNQSFPQSVDRQVDSSKDTNESSIAGGEDKQGQVSDGDRYDLRMGDSESSSVLASTSLPCLVTISEGPGLQPSSTSQQRATLGANKGDAHKYQNFWSAVNSSQSSSPRMHAPNRTCPTGTPIQWTPRGDNGPPYLQTPATPRTSLRAGSMCAAPGTAAAFSRTPATVSTALPRRLSNSCSQRSLSPCSGPGFSRCPSTVNTNVPMSLSNACSSRSPSPMLVGR